MAGPEARYIVGIDLGTTNCAVAYVDTTEEQLPIRILPIQQVVEPGVLGDRELLPSFLYLAAGHEVPPDSLDLPWATGRDFVIGHLARTLGGRAPGRLVSSAKSWLCHARVRRTQPILPWGAPDDVPKRSPVGAQAAYLTHLRAAWNQRMGTAHDLSRQTVILTVPASFDEVARHLTLAAAKIAELQNVVLIEEPQAAFYTYLATHEEDWRSVVKPGETVLVCDIGGGTTDFSLIGVAQGRVGPVFTRRAVGDHILLGGDNMDLALARLCEEKLGSGKLDLSSFSSLLAQVREGKEVLLKEKGTESVPVTLYGRGTSVVGGTLTTSLDRDDVMRLILERFFPAVDFQEEPPSAWPREIGEFGLPYAEDEAITRHLAAFLKRHRGDEAETGPAYLLFNGGVMTPAYLQRAVSEAVESWFGRSPEILPADALFLAVAYGAAYFGRTRHGLGLRIRAGSPRTYYIGVGTGEGEKALCVVPRGAAEEGHGSFTASESFLAGANALASFTLYASSSRDDVSGELVNIDDLTGLPPVRTILRYGRKGAQVDVPVTVRVELTEIGTIELWCEARHSDHRWRLEFAIDEDAPQVPAGVTETVSHEVIDAAGEELRACFGETRSRDPARIARDLEKTTELDREKWPTSLLRGLWDTLASLPEGREYSHGHEARWLNLAGYLLRPGFGDPLDSWRVGRLWRFFARGPLFPEQVENRVQWWILWRRIAGGLDREKQEELYGHLAPPLLRGKGVSGASQETREMWSAAASLERLAAKKRVELGNALLVGIEGGRGALRDVFALARIGAREPLYGGVDVVLPAKVVGKWLTRLLHVKWPKGFRPEFAYLHLSRYTGDRARDLPVDLREEVAARVERLARGEALAESLFQVKPLTAQEEKKLFGDTIPLGLRLRYSTEVSTEG